MNTDSMNKLEFHRIQERLMTYAMSYMGKRHVAQLKPLTNVKQIEQLQREGEEAKRLLDSGSSVPLPSLTGMDTALSRLDKGMALTESDIVAITQFLHGTRQMKRFMLRKADIAPGIAGYAVTVEELESLEGELIRCVPNGSIADDASDGLLKTRKKLWILEDRVRKKLDSLLGKYGAHLQDHIVMSRSGRWVLAVKRESKRLVPGTIVDQSGSGQTVFVEPVDIGPLQQELEELRSLEAMEVSLVLDGLTGLVSAERQGITLNLEVVGHYDFLFAKAKYARAIQANAVRLNDEGIIDLRAGRHPLLEDRALVPLDFVLGEGYRALVITGPNTGGKTVALKTVGLLTMMAQCGLLIPVGDGSELAVFDDVLVDIGDGQSIDQSLSTFSAHVKNIIEILRRTGPRTLVLLDELASGTDPGEGIGLSIAVLEELYRLGARVVATTHFNEIKQFAATSPGFENARMEFDVETLEPLYRLTIGQAGSSYALEIAQKLGMLPSIIARSRSLASDQVPIIEVSRKRPLVPRDEARARNSPKMDEKKAGSQGHGKTFQLGDRVWIHAMKKSGIVSTLPDEKGNLQVLVQKRPMLINIKRVSLYMTRDTLYPKDYDLDIVLESKENRKKRKQMSKRHVEGLVIHHEPDEGGGGR